MDNDTNSNMTKIEDAFMEMYATATTYGPTPIANITAKSSQMPLMSCMVNIEPQQLDDAVPSPTSVRPITGWTNVLIYRSTKNLLPPMASEDTLISGVQWNVNSDGSFYSQGVSGSANSQPYFKDIMLPPGTYWLSGCPENGGTSNKYFLRLIRYNGATTLGSCTDTGSGVGFTVTGEETRIRIFANHYSGVTDKVLWKPQIEAGTSGTTYAKVQSTQRMNFPTTVYGGTLNVLTGLLSVDRVGVDMGTLTWAQYNSSLSGVYYATLDNMAQPQTSADRQTGITSSHYAPDVQTGISDAMGNNRMLRVGNRIYVRNTSYSTAAAFQAAVGGATLVYPVASPLNYRITPFIATTIAKDNYIWCNAGNKTVSYGGLISSTLKNGMNYADSKLPTTGGTVTGNVTVQTDSLPMVVLASAEKEGVGRARTVLQKNATAESDMGTILFDYVWGPGNTNQKYLRMYLKAAASTTKELLYLYYKPETGSAATYYLYGDHNPVTAKDVVGLLSGREVITSGANLNTYLTAGCYLSSSTAVARQILYTPEADASTHLNSAILSFKLDVEVWSSVTVSQTLTTLNGVQYMRYTGNANQTTPTWGNWVKMTP